MKQKYRNGTEIPHWNCHKLIRASISDEKRHGSDRPLAHTRLGLPWLQMLKHNFCETKLKYIKIYKTKIIYDMKALISEWIHLTDFPPTITRQTFLWLPGSPPAYNITFWKGVHPKRKEFAPLGSEFFPFRGDPFPERRQTILKDLPPLKVYSFLLWL